ncbi:MAG: ketoacyl-ACP synthase III [Coriobacteriales bacterium]|jgi:3-oxoacyl-[acyl-carrier-protein] synthase-3|nr:ketoacyl-ACP synthase III [Coriobacteriales bacterium]
MQILGTGRAVPQNILTNDMLAKMVDTSDEWIVTRTGIHSRHIATTESIESLAVVAAQNALAAAQLTPHDIDIVICATVTNEQATPSLACLLQRDLGLREDILAFDLSAACSGFVFSLITAQGLLQPGQRALVLGAELLSKVTDFTERSTCVLFGDGAGAVLVAPSSKPFYWTTGVRGDAETLTVAPLIHMNGPAVFKFAVEVLAASMHNVITQAGVEVDQIDHFVCHQANERILASAAKRLGVPLEKFVMNLATHGNTSAASIPLVLDEAVRDGIILPGQRIVIAGFGGGLTYGAIYLEQ